MKTNALQRSKKFLTDNGWQVAIVEKFLQKFGNMKFPRRVDVWGFGDLLACRHRIITTDGPRGLATEWREVNEIALIQCCPGASHAQHKEKILAIPERLTWKAAGGIVLLHSWSKKGPRGKMKRWTLREEQL